MTTEPEFKPKPGQTDYTNIKRAPVINCVVKYKDKILLVQRSANMKFYPGYWNGISGFLDDSKTAAEKVKDELQEELGVEEKNIVAITQGDIFEQEEPKYDKIWIVHPVLVEVSTDTIRLDWEAQNYQWVSIAEAKSFNLLPGFERVLENLF